MENYRVFAAAAPDVIEGCPCCIASRKVDTLLTRPLRALSGQDLWRYVSGVFHTIGSERDFRYLLPRILEISVIDPRNANDPEIVLAKLRLGRWHGWAERERRAVEEFVDAWFEIALMRDLARADELGASHHAESVLCGAALAGFSLSRWLGRLCDADAAPVLADLVARYPDHISPFWKDTPEGLCALTELIKAA